MPDSPLVLDLALTIRHDGHGGVADDLTDPDGLTVWVRQRLPELGEFTADAGTLAAVRDLRAAVRALFAKAVRPAEPSPADARRLLPESEAVARLNAAAARVPVVPVFDWTGEPASLLRPVAAATPADVLVAELARAAIAFLAGPDRGRLRACHAPRCVRYFLKEHPRQEWCKPSCGNRARVARHHERHRKESL
ncbi:CGNR zinc finger domain-containing protein [Streptomyces indicus]|uniref:Conserved protein containing a Zn-ribbon-like motif, possibly RNA-binding n=1 Tax=Streptomyces indicus TaxID=417292 RepID=A0A1G8ZTN3_9ACTN|nr:ABATE domain-containing protein [Streptomyces indicus]SDK17964.1 Conserved protein containing a Zn-ribbon-like motif, possibly RNA-binding [Streptomyces indicus]